MAVHLFYEETKPRAVPEGTGDAHLEIDRYYYDDISDEVLIRSFQSDAARSRPPTFLAEDRVPLSEVSEDIRPRMAHLKSHALE